MAFLAFLAPSCKENGPFSPHHLVFATINLHNEVGQKKHTVDASAEVLVLCAKSHPEAELHLLMKTRVHCVELCCVVDK